MCMCKIQKRHHFSQNFTGLPDPVQSIATLKNVHTLSYNIIFLVKKLCKEKLTSSISISVACLLSDPTNNLCSTAPDVGEEVRLKTISDRSQINNSK